MAKSSTAKADATPYDPPATGHLSAVDDAEVDGREALNKAVVELAWKGQTFTIPKRRGRWPTRAAREFNRENYVEAIVALLGEEQWARLEELCPLVDDINEFAEYAGPKINAECVP